MANWHYYNEDGERVGPVTGRQLKKLALHGVVVPGTVVETEDGTTGLAKNVQGLTFADSALKLETVLRPHNEVGFTPSDAGEIYGLTTLPEQPEPSDEPTLVLVSESVVENAPAPTPVVRNVSSSSTDWTASRWDWETLWNRSIISLFLLLVLIGVVVFAGVQWYIPSSQQRQQVAGEIVEQQRQNAEARAEQIAPPPFENIFEAAEKGTVEDIRFFLVRGRGVDQADERGWTSLHYAAEHNHNVGVMQFLIAQGADVNVRNNDGWTPLDVAQLDEVRVVLREAGAIPYQSPFEDILEAATNGTVRDVAYFVQNGVDVNAGNHWGATPLLFAARHNSNVEVAKYLISQNANVNARIWNGVTPLHEATANSNVEVLKYLVSVRGANVNIEDNEGVSPLDWADTNEKRAILRAAGAW